MPRAAAEIDLRVSKRLSKSLSQLRPGTTNNGFIDIRIGLLYSSIVLVSNLRKILDLMGEHPRGQFLSWGDNRNIFIAVSLFIGACR
jgi:hypothetical protein